MFVIQCLDHEEGTLARWHDLVGQHPTKDEAVQRMRKIQAEEADSESLCVYRVREVGTDAYYSQPQDQYEY